MKKGKWKAYVLSILLAEAVGALAGFLTRAGVERYQMVAKPALTPPSTVFPIVWSLLFLLMGISAARIWLSTDRRKEKALSIYAVQLVVNFFWSLLFFNLQAFGIAFFWLILLCFLVFIMIVAFWQIDRKAAYLQIPYLLWILFAAYLNLGVWLLNR